MIVQSILFREFSLWAVNLSLKLRKPVLKKMKETSIRQKVITLKRELQSRA